MDDDNSKDTSISGRGAQNSTGVYLNGASPTIPAIDLTPSGINLHSGSVFQAHVSYNGSNLTLTLPQPGTTNSFSQTWTGVNLAATLGSSNGYVGFTAGTGGYSQGRRHHQLQVPQLDLEPDFQLAAVQRLCQTNQSEQQSEASSERTIEERSAPRISTSESAESVR